MEATLRIGGLLREVLVADLPPESVAGPDGRVLLRPWNLRHEEYIEHAFSRLRQAAPAQPLVVATLLRVLRMLVQHVQEAGRDEHVPALRRQIRLLLETVQDQPGLHPEDLARLRAVAEDATDPAEHGDPLPDARRDGRLARATGHGQD